MTRLLPKVIIIILNYKSYELTINLVERLHQGLRYNNFEIVVVDNNSPNESYKVLKDKSYKDGKKQFTLLLSDYNYGYAAGNNIGLRYAINDGAKYSLILNNDIEFEDADFLEKLVFLLEGNNKIGAASPQILNPDKTNDKPRFIDKPSFYDLTLGMISHQRKRIAFNSCLSRQVYAVRGCCVILNNIIASKIDSFDENTFLYAEEQILAERLLAVGALSWHCAESEVIHNHSITINSSLNKKQVSKHLINSWDYYLKKYRNMNALKRFICRCFRYAGHMIKH